MANELKKLLGREITINLQSIEYSKIGEYHKENHLGNQDYTYSKETTDGAFYAVADGVSSCENSRKGAEIACIISAKVILDDIDYYFDSTPEKTISLILANIRHRICKIAKETNNKDISYASTLCFVCVHKKRHQVMTFVLGDSRVYFFSSELAYQKNPVHTYDDNVTCTTMTKFAQEDAGFSIDNYSEDDRFILCTDGCWKNLFYIDEKNNTVMKKVDSNEIIEYLNDILISDDCSFLTVA